MEIWKDIEGYEGLYQVSNEGRVKSLQREIVYKDGRKKVLEEKILHNLLSDLGYYHVMLSKNCVPKRYKVHRLVAKAFIANPNNLPVINHKDECKTNNFVENLEWCTQGYNVRYGTRIERGRQKQLNREDLSKEVEQYTLNGDLVKTFKSVREVERKNPQFKKSSIARCCRNNKSYKCYIWKYKKG